MRDESYTMTPHEQAMVETFTMARTKHGTGKGIAFTVRVLAYPDGTIYISDADRSDLKEVYGPKADAAKVFAQLCQRAVGEARCDSAEPEAQV